MKNYRKTLLLTGFSVLMLTGCGNVKQELGLTHPPPDEFTVLKRAPLSMPPDYGLRPPQPGAVRPQDVVAADQARTTVFGGHAEATQAAPTSADAILLKDTGADNANPDIRRAVDQETAALVPRKKPISEKLLGWTHSGAPAEPTATVVDPAKEAARIKTDQQQGKPVTAGDTPTKEE
jgi:hypothetical protein